VLLQELLSGVGAGGGGRAGGAGAAIPPPPPGPGHSTPAAPRARGAPAPRARALKARLDGDLDTIVACALAPDPQRRYAGVAALAADIERTLAQRPIHARAPSAVYRAGKFLRRHRLGVV